MVREPAVAGQFYPADFTELEKQLHACFVGDRGPGALPVSARKGKVKAVVVPHAGYQFSGACAAWAYKEIAEAALPDIFILLGPNHRGTGTAISIEDWRTPFGLVRTDKDFVIGLKEHTPLSINEDLHQEEHSLEVQLPFLQFINKDALDKIKIAPILIDKDLPYAQVAEEMLQYLETANKEVTIIASSDLTHYGPNYYYLPFTTDIPRRLKELDTKAIKLIENGDVQEFRQHINRTHVTICGYMPILLLLEMLKGKQKGKLLRYYTSGELLGDYRNSVSYASILFD